MSVSDRLLCGDRAWRRAACMSGLVALIAGLGLIFAACGSSAGIILHPARIQVHGATTASSQGTFDPA
jgi:hypothetical protein